MNEMNQAAESSENDQVESVEGFVECREGVEFVLNKLAILLSDPADWTLYIHLADNTGQQSVTANTERKRVILTQFQQNFGENEALQSFEYNLRSVNNIRQYPINKESKAIIRFYPYDEKIHKALFYLHHTPAFLLKPLGFPKVLGQLGSTFRFGDKDTSSDSYFRSKEQNDFRCLKPNCACNEHSPLSPPAEITGWNPFHICYNCNTYTLYTLDRETQKCFSCKRVLWTF